MDTLDKKILNLLQKDSTLPVQQEDILIFLLMILTRQKLCSTQ